MSGGTDLLRLRAHAEEDLAVISSLVQDAILPVRNIEWDPRQKRLILVVQRYCWERCTDSTQDLSDGKESGERIASAIRFDSVLRFRSRGIDQKSVDQVAYLLGLQFRPGSGPGGELRFLCSNNAELSADLECIDGVLMDVSKPWIAAGRPTHPLDG